MCAPVLLLLSSRAGLFIFEQDGDGFCRQNDGVKTSVVATKSDDAGENRCHAKGLPSRLLVELFMLAGHYLTSSNKTLHFFFQSCLSSLCACLVVLSLTPRPSIHLLVIH